MSTFCQGDIISIEGYSKMLFVVVSKNAFIRATGVFHVCLMQDRVPAGPVHIAVIGKQGTKGTVICEQIKLIDPAARACNKKDTLNYGDIMDVSDAVQGLFEYD